MNNFALSASFERLTNKKSAETIGYYDIEALDCPSNNNTQ